MRMRTNHSKRVVSVIVALSMILTMMSGLSFSTVSAATAVSVDTWGELKTALESSGDKNITVTADIEYTATSASAATSNCISVSTGNKTVDLNGKCVSFIVDSFEYMEVSGVPKSPVTVSGSASLTIKDTTTYGIFEFIANKSDHYPLTAPKQSGGLISVLDTATVKVVNAKLNNVAIGPCINVTSGSPTIVLDGALLTTGSSLFDWSGGFALFISDATTKPSITFSNKTKLSCSNTNTILCEYSNGAGAMYVGNTNASITVNSVTLAGTVQVRVPDSSATKLPFVSVSTHQIKVNKTIHTKDVDYLLGPENFDISADSTDVGAGHYHMVIVEKIVAGGVETTNCQSIMTEITKLSDVVEENDVYDSIPDAFAGAYGANEEEFEYGFSPDTVGGDLVYGSTHFKDKFTTSLGSLESSITAISRAENDVAAKMSGFAQFYSDNRWTCASEISFDLKMVSEGNDFAGFYVKYGKEIISGDKNSVFYSNDEVRADGANSTTGTTGIGFSFRTIDNKPCIEIFVKYLDNNGKLCVSSNYYYDVVDDLKIFNNYRVSDDNNGTIKFYANDVLFATVICSDAKVPTKNTAYKEQYYSTVKLLDKNGSTVATVSDALVSKDSAIAFATRNQDLEFDNFNAVDKTNTDPKVDTATLMLGNDITLRYAAYKSNIDAAGYTNLRLHVMRENATTAEVLSPKTGVLNGQDAYFFYFENISPHMMNDNVYFVLYGELDGTVYASTPKQFGVATYAYQMLSLPDNYVPAKLKTLIVDMLRFGSAAQIYKSHKTDALVDAALTAQQAAFGTKFENVNAFENDLKAPGADEYDESWTATWKTVTLLLDNKINIQAAFAIDDIEGVCVKVTDSEGTLVETLTTKDFTKKVLSNGQEAYSFVLNNMNVNNVRKEYYFTVYNKYDQHVSGTLIFSAETYAYMNQNNTTTKGLADLVKTMVVYGDAAAAYVS